MNKSPLENKSPQERVPIKAEIGNPEEWEAIRDFRLAAIHESPASFDEKPEKVSGRSAEEWANIIAGPDNFIVLGKEGSEIVGMLAAEEMDGFFPINHQSGELVKRIWCIHWGYLKPELRKIPAGFAIRGLQKCLEEIDRRKGEAAYLVVLKGNENKEAIIKICEKFGFKIMEGVDMFKNVLLVKVFE